MWETRWLLWNDGAVMIAGESEPARSLSLLSAGAPSNRLSLINEFIMDSVVVELSKKLGFLVH